MAHQAAQPFTGQEIVLRRMTTIPGGIPPLTTNVRLPQNEGDDPDPPNIPYWLAPWPYPHLFPGPQKTGKVRIEKATETRFVAKFLERLLRNPGYDQPLRRPDHYLTDRDIAWGLNAYNMRTAVREFRAWALFHRFGNTSVFKAPRNRLGGAPALNGAKLVRDLGPRADYFNFARDLHPGPPAWVSPAVNPWRSNANAKRYRLICWLHRHEAPGGQWRNDQYSMTVWDRDTGDLTWHDPWPANNSGQRFTEIQNIWHACQQQQEAHFWPGMPPANTLVQRSYASLIAKQGQPNFAHLQPKFSQIACVALGVWLMNNLEQAGVLTPPDTDDVLSGTRPELMPHLAAVLLQTLRETPSVNGSGNVTIHKNTPVIQGRVRKTYRVLDTNVWLRNQMNAKLNQMYPAPNASRWLINSIT